MKAGKRQNMRCTGITEQGVGLLRQKRLIPKQKRPGKRSFRTKRFFQRGSKACTQSGKTVAQVDTVGGDAGRGARISKGCDAA